MPIKHSIAGYLHEIGFLHDEHFPLKNTQLNIGIFSYQYISFPHRGHRDLGRLMGISLGILYANAFKKLPTMHPKINII